MAQFDVYYNSDERSRGETPYLLDVQSNFFSDLATRLVIPLRPGTEEDPWVISRLHPPVIVEGEPFIAVASEIAGVPETVLGNRIGDAKQCRRGIVGAIDLLITGF